MEIAEEGEGNGIEAQLQTYLLESFASGTEGLMLKALDTNATYQASKRSESWIKLKRQAILVAAASLQAWENWPWHD